MWWVPASRHRCLLGLGGRSEGSQASEDGQER